MNNVLIRDSKVLSILGFHFDSRLTWSYMIDSSVRCCRQRLGCLRQVSEYLGSEGLILAYQAFVRPVAEYGSVLMMGASATQLSKFDRMQHHALNSYAPHSLYLLRSAVMLQLLVYYARNML